MQRIGSSKAGGLVFATMVVCRVGKGSVAASPSHSPVATSLSAVTQMASHPQNCGTVMSFRFCTTTPPEDPIKKAILTFNTLRRMHAVEPHHDRRQRLQQQAWRTIQGLSEEDIEKADNRGVATVLVSWAYFARFWENGRDGPASPLPAGASADDIPVEIDASSSIIHDPDRNKTQNAAKTREDIVEAPRQEVLDEVFE